MSRKVKLLFLIKPQRKAAVSVLSTKHVGAAENAALITKSKELTGNNIGLISSILPSMTFVYLAEFKTRVDFLFLSHRLPATL